MKRNYLYYLLTILLLAVSCEKDEMACTTAVETQEVSSIAATTAQCGGIISSDGYPTINEAGVEWCTTSDFESNVSCASIARAKLGKFACEITNLKDNTQYYVRAYARNSYGTIYGEVLSFKTLELIPPIVLTDFSAIIVYSTSATVGGEVTNDGNGVVTERGVVYSTTPNPTTSNSKVVSGSGKGSFTCNLNDLQVVTTYYVRAYAVNEKGTAYGEEKSFTTKAITIPTVTTSSATSISYTSATIDGTVTDDGGASVTERGVVYSTTPNPTTSNSKVSSGSGKGAFSCNLNDLQAGTTYYVRAYAVNEKGTAYGEQQSFMTKKAIFSVSSSKKVIFSSGNLQYHPANNKWRFAENQTDYIGDANSNCSSTYNGWLDLFGWSGNTGSAKFGVSTSTTNSDYSGSFVDWGTNKIGNDAPNTWRTLTYDEWKYLLKNRPNANSLKGVAQVNGVNGLILLPDSWTCPSGVTFKSGFHSSSGVDNYAAYQTFTAEQWSKLESAGAVFLPAAGDRIGSNVRSVQHAGDYWSATEFNSDWFNGNCARYLYFYSAEADMGYNYRNFGLSVRLVKDL